MEIIEEKYKGRTYLKYISEGKTVYNNASYFIIDLKCQGMEDLKPFGGFFANMTIRYVEEHKSIRYLMLCCIPQNDNKFLFKFIYLDRNKNIREMIDDKCFFDYELFKKKFKECIIEEGMVFDLEGDKKFKKITNLIGNCSKEYSFKIDGKNVSWDDKFVSYDFEFFNDELKSNLGKIGAKKIVWNFAMNGFSGVSLQGMILDGNDNPLPNYQVSLGILDFEEFCKHENIPLEEGNNRECFKAPYQFLLAYDNMEKLHIFDGFKFYTK